jgi:hypothetical protein
LLAVPSIHRLVEHAMKKVRMKMCSRDYELLLLRFLSDCYVGIESYWPSKKPFQQSDRLNLSLRKVNKMQSYQLRFYLASKHFFVCAEIDPDIFKENILSCLPIMIIYLTFCTLAILKTGLNFWQGRKLFICYSLH